MREGGGRAGGTSSDDEDRLLIWAQAEGARRLVGRARLVGRLPEVLADGEAVLPDLGGAEAAAQRDLADGVGGDEARVHRFVEPRGVRRAEVGHHRGERDRAVAAAVDVGEDLTREERERD